VKFLDDILNANTSHPNASTYWIYTFLQGSNGYLRAITRFASNILDFYLTVEDFGNFVFQQAAQHVAVGAADNNLWATIPLFDFQQICP